MQFSRVITPVEEIQIWNATSYGFSFVISYQSRGGPGLQGNPGFVASWRPVYQNGPAVKVVGSPFRTFNAAEQACEVILESVRRLQAGLQSFLSMRRIEARRKNASAFWLRHSQSLAKRRQRLSHAMVRSTIQRLGKTANPLI